MDSKAGDPAIELEILTRAFSQMRSDYSKLYMDNLLLRTKIKILEDSLRDAEKKEVEKTIIHGQE